MGDGIREIGYTVEKKELQKLIKKSEMVLSSYYEGKYSEFDLVSNYECLVSILKGYMVQGNQAEKENGDEIQSYT